MLLLLLSVVVVVVVVVVMFLVCLRSDVLYDNWVNRKRV